jgi:phosphohistidine phosphatase
LERLGGSAAENVSASKHLALLRHAKSSWSNPDLPDHDRPLAPRGRRAAERMGVYIQEKGLVPDLVLCSSARRARQTLDLLELPSNTVELVEDELYGATATALIARLSRVGDATHSVLLIGHNPSIHEAATNLASNPDAVAQDFPTAALAEFLVPTLHWKDLGPGVADLKAFTTPRSLN